MVSATRINHNCRIVLTWCGNSLTVLMESGGDADQPVFPYSPHSTIFIARITDRCDQLLPIELPLAEGRGRRRRDEFSSGRYCARRAMAARGLPGGAVLTGPGRSPVWPAGTCGSLTHSRHLVGAAVSDSLSSLGLDIEHFGRLSVRAAERILTETEREVLHHLDADFLRLATIVFSAKEAVYKAIYPIAGLYVGYREVQITLSPQHAEFRASYLGQNELNRPLEVGVGHWGLIEEAVLTRFEIGERG
jgi:4'-phosphopantetheinyl transferase EntD